jgi:hypothetical protein
MGCGTSTYHKRKVVGSNHIIVEGNTIPKQGYYVDQSNY